MNIGPLEILVILVIAVLIFGARLPEVGREVGRAFHEFKRGLRDIRDSSGVDESLRDFRDLRNETRHIARTEYNPFGASSDETWNGEPEKTPTEMVEDPDDTFTEPSEEMATEDSDGSKSQEDVIQRKEGEAS